MDSIAAQAPSDIDTCWVVTDAQRRQLHVARYGRGSQREWQRQSPVQLVDGASWFSSLPTPNWLIGSGLIRWRESLPAGLACAPEQDWTPRAETLGRIAVERLAAGSADDIWTLVPQYYRTSAAEEKLAR
jgi:tRNA A37 threonylcarbamoyladenosine modification protein TsaB